MLKTLIAAALAATTLFATASAEAQQPRQPLPTPSRVAHQGADGMWLYACNGKGTARVADGSTSTDCRCSTLPALGKTCTGLPASNMSPMPQPGPVASASPAAAPAINGSFVASQLDELVQQGIRDREINQRQAKPAPPVVAQAAPVVQAPAQPNRVFTPGVSIEVLAGAFKEGSESNILNAPASDIVSAIRDLSGVTVTPEMLVNGSLITCQKAGVEKKTRIGVKTKQNMNGLKEFSFVSMSYELKECLPGQKLYVVNSHGKFIAIADDSGMLLGPPTAVSGIKIDG